MEAIALVGCDGVGRFERLGRVSGGRWCDFTGGNPAAGEIGGGCWEAIAARIA